jgi:serine/threonine-protein kinase HipA
MHRSATIYFKTIQCGQLHETESGYFFQYDAQYLLTDKAEQLSLTMPLQSARYESKTLFPFFDGLIPEGWLLDLAKENWKIQYRDRMGLLLACCKDCIGAVSVIDNEEL